MKSRMDWINEALEETPHPIVDALTVYFGEKFSDGFSHSNAEDLLGYLLREGFKVVEDDKKRGV